MRWLAILPVIAALIGPVASASAKHPKLPAVPRCVSFSAKKVSHVLHVGKSMYLQHAVLGTSCEYYGLTIKRATKLAKRFVPYEQIVYYPSLMISAAKTSKVLFDKQLVVLEQQDYTQQLISETAPWRIAGKVHGSEEYVFHGAQTGAKLPDCDPMGKYNNWLGPPACRQQPALDHVQVVAWVPTGKALGVLVFLSASNEEGAPLSITHVLKLAKETTTGAIY